MDETNRALPVLFGLVAASAANGVTAALSATASAAMRFDLMWSLLCSGLVTGAKRASGRDPVWTGGVGRAGRGLLQHKADRGEDGLPEPEEDVRMEGAGAGAHRTTGPDAREVPPRPGGERQVE